jgi:alkylation response protein AidB-like acyl-CoA dehydrogenase
VPARRRVVPSTVEAITFEGETMTITSERTDPLTQDMLERFDARAAGYDRENQFFTEDFEELRASGYLDLPLPKDMGGAGYSMAQVNRAQRRLARVAPATALAVNMHLYWVGLAADLRSRGDDRCNFILQAAADGKILAAGHAERGNDIPVLLSTTTAERADGGWRLNGHKMFGSLSPVWDYLGFHAIDPSDPAGPRIVHGFLPRDTPGVQIIDTWDTMGMRATASQDTVLDGAFCPDENVVVVCPAGFAGADPFHVSLFAWALLGFAGVYLAIAERAFEESVREVGSKTSVALSASMAHHPEVQHGVAEMRMALETATALLDRSVDEWSAGVDHGHDWVVKIVTTKHVVVSEAWKVADTAMEITGGAGIFRKNRLEQLFRDARLGRIHPTNPLLTRELVAKLSLGIDPDATPRWG